MSIISLGRWFEAVPPAAAAGTFFVEPRAPERAVRSALRLAQIDAARSVLGTHGIWGRRISADWEQVAIQLMAQFPSAPVLWRAPHGDSDVVTTSMRLMVPGDILPDAAAAWLLRQASGTASLYGLAFGP